MKENKSMRQTLVRLLKPLHAISVENGGCHPGTPDINYVEGWIENKTLSRWPARETTAVRVPLFKPQQRIWLLRRCKAGGRAFLMLNVGRDWLLFRGDDAAANLGYVTKETLFSLAVRTWKGTPNQQELIECLSRPRN